MREELRRRRRDRRREATNNRSLGRLDALVVRGRVGLALQSRVVRVKSGLRPFLGRLEPRDLGGRVVDGLLKFFSTLRSQARGAVLRAALLLLRLLGLGLVGLRCGFLF